MIELFRVENNPPDSNGYLSDIVRPDAKRPANEEPLPTYYEKMLAQRDAFRAAKKRSVSKPPE